MNYGRPHSGPRDPRDGRDPRGPHRSYNNYDRSDRSDRPDRPDRPRGHEYKPILWMGGLDPKWHDMDIKRLWSDMGEPRVFVRVRKDRQTGQSLGFCSLEFDSDESARRAMARNGQPIPGTPFVVNLQPSAEAFGSPDSFSGPSNQQFNRSDEYSLFVGDLSSDVTDATLIEAFRGYPSVRSAQMMTDAATGASRGFGFVRFGNEAEMLRALNEMQGKYIGSRPIRVSTAAPKSRGPAQSMGYSAVNSGPPAGAPTGPRAAVPTGPAYSAPTGPSYGGSSGVTLAAPLSAYPPLNQNSDPHNTTLFVAGIAIGVSEDQLREYFESFGPLVYTKVPPNTGCAFVQFYTRPAAEQALRMMNGYVLGNSRLKLSWGKGGAAPSGAVGAATVASLPYRAGPALPYSEMYGNVTVARDDGIVVPAVWEPRPTLGLNSVGIVPSGFQVVKGGVMEKLEEPSEPSGPAKMNEVCLREWQSRDEHLWKYEDL